MKPNFQTFLPLCLTLLLTSCTPAGNKPSEDRGSEDNIISSSDTSHESSIEGVHLNLPIVDGFSFELVNPEVQLGETAQVAVVNLHPGEKKILSFTVDGNEIAGQPCGVPNVQLYSFPLRSPVPIISAIAAEVKAVRSADSRLILGDLGEPYFAAGESVVFSAGTIPGYTLTSLTVLSGNVDLKNNEGVYSFTMGDEEVLLSGSFYKNHYPITYASSEAYAVSFASGAFYEFEDAVAFTVTPASSDYSIAAVKANGKALEKFGDFYLFDMPACPVELTIETIQNYKVVEILDSEHYSVSVTTYANNEWIPITDSNVLSNQTLHVKPSPKGEVGNYVIDHIEIYQKQNENDEYVASNVEVSVGERFMSFVTPTAKFIQIRVYEKEEIPVSIPHSYAGFSLGNASSSIAFASLGDGKYTYRGLDEVTLTGKSDGSIAVKASGELSGYSYEYQTRFFLSEDQGILLSRELSSTTSYGTVDMARKTALVAMLKEGNTLSEGDSYAIMVVDGNKDLSDDTKHVAELLVLNDGTSTRYCYYDFEEEKAYFDVKVTGSGTTSGSLYTVEINGKSISFTVNSSSRTSRQYYANFSN